MVSLSLTPQVQAQKMLPSSVEGETTEVLEDTISPDEKLAMAIHTVTRSKTLSLEIVRPADGTVLWRSNPTGDDSDVFRYRLRAHGFRDMQYAWSPDSKLLAMALATSRGSWVFVFQMQGDGAKSSSMTELSDEELFGDQLPTDPALVAKQGGVRKLYMNLEFTSNTVLEVSTEGFFIERETKPGIPVRTLYYEATIAYDLDPAAPNKVPSKSVNITPVSDKDDMFDLPPLAPPADAVAPVAPETPAAMDAAPVATP